MSTATMTPHSAQAQTLEGIETMQQYTDWMQGMITPIPDGTYEILSFGIDEERRSVSGYGVYRGTHLGDGGPVPPTERSFEADYVYVMQFDGEKISHLTKIWNDVLSLKQLGWV